MVDRAALSSSGQRVLTLSVMEADRLNHNYIGTEHILLGMCRDEDGIAVVLADMGVRLLEARKAVEFIIGRGEGRIMGEISPTPRTKKVLELALDEAQKLGQNQVGAAHILLGLIREGDGIGVGVMESLGVDLDQARARVLETLEVGS